MIQGGLYRLGDTEWVVQSGWYKVVHHGWYSVGGT